MSKKLYVYLKPGDTRWWNDPTTKEFLPIQVTVIKSLGGNDWWETTDGKHVWEFDLHETKEEAIAFISKLKEESEWIKQINAELKEKYKKNDH